MTEPSREVRKAARLITRAAESSGRLVRPEGCDDCEWVGPVHAHHVDYFAPLEIRWLCPNCHALEHVRLRQAAAPGGFVWVSVRTPGSLARTYKARVAGDDLTVSDDIRAYIADRVRRAREAGVIA